MSESLAVEAVDVIKAASGSKDGFRAAHAKGTVLAGSFTATPEAAALTRAPHMQGDPVKVTVRFSNGAGNPEAPDYAARDGRGMSTKFYLQDGGRTDIVALSLPCFFVRTPQDFVEFTRTRVPDPETGEPDMEKIGAFLEAHQEALRAIQFVLAAKPPASYANVAYNSIHSFKWTGADGEERFVRYRWEPEAGEESLEPEDAKARGGDYLQEEIAERVTGEGAAFRLFVVIADDGDDVDDPTVAWPEEREKVEVGRVELTGIDESRERDGDVMVMDPTRVVDGIELSGDKILRFRAHAYSVSVERRSGEPPPADLPD
jgi:catalase